MKKVDIYVLEEKIKLGGSGGCGCSCSCGSSSSSVESVSIESLVNDFKQKHSTIGDFNIINLSKEKNQQMLDTINEVLTSNNERLILSKANYNFVIPKILPMIVVNGKIVAINSFPRDDELYNAIKTESRITKQSGCC